MLTYSLAGSKFGSFSCLPPGSLLDLSFEKFKASSSKLGNFDCRHPWQYPNVKLVITQYKFGWNWSTSVQTILYCKMVFILLKIFLQNSEDFILYIDKRCQIDDINIYIYIYIYIYICILDVFLCLSDNLKTWENAPLKVDFFQWRMRVYYGLGIFKDCLYDKTCAYF